MARSYYAHVREAWKDPDEGTVGRLQWERMQRWRREGALVRIDRPTRIDRARALGYKAKQGIVVVRARIRKGTARKSRFTAGRRSTRQGVHRIGRTKNAQRIAEERASRKYPNLEVLNSYWVGEDGKRRWFEVILVDPHHPAIEADDDLNWICEPSQRNRVMRGLTAAGRRARGLNNRGTGAEKVRPSRGAGR
ncbi:MAG: 50S ribosomal protein L15e [Halobacteriales archaeon]